MVYKLIVTIMLVIFTTSIVLAGDTNKIGTVGASELLIPVGARSIALGNASVASATGVEAIHWNPAGLVNAEKSEVMFNNMAYIADISFNYLGVSYNSETMGALGLYIKSMDIGDIDETTVDMPEGTGRSFSPSCAVGGLTYSRRLTNNISAGLTGKYIYESIMQTSASTFAFDFGVQYNFQSGLLLGVSLKNIGGKMQFDGRNLEQKQSVVGSDITADEGYFKGVSEDFDIPSTFSFGLAYNTNIGEANALQVASSFNYQNDAADQVFAGVEYGFNDFAFLRGGYAADLQKTDDSLFGFSLGGGVNIPLGDFYIIIDYAYRNVENYFDASNVFSVKVGL